MQIIALLHCLGSVLSPTTRRQMSRVITALLAMTGRVTMLGLARWTESGGSYRTVQRWFATSIAWPQVFVLFFRQYLFRPQQVYLLAGDEVIVTKAGKQTHGLDRFYAGLLRKVVPGLSFFTLSLISPADHCAYPVAVEQTVRSAEEKAAAEAQRSAEAQPHPPRKPGRPKGSKTKNKLEPPLTPELQRIQGMLRSLVSLTTGWLPLTYLALDGHFGNHYALAMVRQCGLHLISKLRTDAELYVPYAGPPASRGAQCKYGDRVRADQLPAAWLKQTTVAEGIETRIYQATLLHREHAQPLNVVYVVKINQRTQAHGHVLLFSSDLTLAWDRLVEYYSLRFQIEFNFRDAKQYWGLEDFMNIKETPVTNAANLSFFMVNVAEHLRRQQTECRTDYSVLDLKAAYRGAKYVSETLKMLPEKPTVDLVQRILRRVGDVGRIHPPTTPPPSP
jgi:putative transposase